MAASSAGRTAGFSGSFTSHSATKILESIAVVMATHLAKIANYGLPAAGNSGISDSLILCKRALGSHRSNTETGAIFLKLQFVARPDAHRSTNFIRHGDLSFAGDSSLPFHGRSPIPYFSIQLLTSEGRGFRIGNGLDGHVRRVARPLTLRVPVLRCWKGGTFVIVFCARISNQELRP